AGAGVCEQFNQVAAPDHLAALRLSSIDHDGRERIDPADHQRPSVSIRSAKAGGPPLMVVGISDAASGTDNENGDQEQAEYRPENMGQSDFCFLSHSVPHTRLRRITASVFASLSRPHLTR